MNDVIVLIDGHNNLSPALQEAINKLNEINENSFPFIPNDFSSAKELADMGIEEEYSITQIKTKIKRCKNPMELKELNRKLNCLYKERKNHESKISI